VTMSTNRARGPQRVRVSGDLDLVGGDELEALVRPLLRTGAQVAIDLRDVEIADSSGLGALLVLNQLAGEVGASLVLLAPSPSLVRVLDLTATLELFTIAGSKSAPRHRLRRTA
jgi:anti-sigma B factor antagonist